MGIKIDDYDKEYSDAINEYAFIFHTAVENQVQNDNEFLEFVYVYLASLGAKSDDEQEKRQSAIVEGLDRIYFDFDQGYTKSIFL